MNLEEIQNKGEAIKYLESAISNINQVIEKRERDRNSIITKAFEDLAYLNKTFRLGKEYSYRLINLTEQYHRITHELNEEFLNNSRQRFN